MNNYSMQHIALFQDGENLFCLVTGHQLLHPEYFDPSTATIFNYFDDYKEFNEATNEIEKLYAECLHELGIAEAEDLLPFKMLIEEKLKNYHKQYLLFELSDGHHNLFYCFDLLKNSKNRLLNLECNYFIESAGIQEVSFNMEINELYCPLTGQKIVDHGKFLSSPSIEFIYSHTEKQFNLINLQLKKRLLKEHIEQIDHSIYRRACAVLKEEYTLENQHFILTFGTINNRISVCFNMNNFKF